MQVSIEGLYGNGFANRKFTKNTTFTEDDCRYCRESFGDEYYNFFDDGKPNADLLNKLDSIREILTSNGRTLTQGALAWIWAKSEYAIQSQDSKRSNKWRKMQGQCSSVPF